MFKTIPLIALFISSVGGIFFNYSRLQKYFSIFSLFFFVLDFFWPNSIETIRWFSIGSLNFEFSLNFSDTELVICSLVCSILTCLHIAKSSLKSDKQLNKKFGLIDCFVFFMCLSVLSNNMFQFFIGIEAMGLISAIFVSLEKNAVENSIRTLVFNKFASLMFLMGTFLIAVNINSFDFSVIKQFFESGNSSILFLSACLILISCLCKGAQFPFSYWLLDAVKANIFASIIIHSATIIAVGILFIAKCYFLFESFPILKEIMIFSGLFTAIWMAFKSLFHNNIKKIIACLTCCSSGIMFISCGIGQYSLAILYFICHAFYKSMIFLSFYYVIRAMSYEQNILRMGGLNNIIPKVNDALWISFAACVGVPFFVGFFAKISLMSAIQFSGRLSLEICDIIVNIVSIAAVFRAILISMYGKSRASESTLSRARDFNSESVLPIWILLGFATFGSFICHILYKCGKLHFGYGGMVFVREPFDYFVENVIEIAQIVIAILMVLFFSKLSVIKKNSKLRSYLLFLFKNNFIYSALIKLIKNFLYSIFASFNKINDNLNILLNYKSFRIIYAIGNIIQSKHKCSLYSHLLWILTGITVNLICYILWRAR